MTTTATTTARGTGRIPGAFRLGLARIPLELRVFFREREAIIFIFAYPVVMLAIFASVFGQDGATVGPGDGIPFAQYFLPGMIATGIVLSSFQQLAISIAIERDEGALKRLRGTPMPAAAYFIGKIGLVMTVSIGQTALLLLAAHYAFDVPMPSDVTTWLTFVWLFLLGVGSGAILGVGFSSVPRSGRSANALVTPVVLVLQFISGVFFSFYDLPAWMRDLSSVFPLKWIAQGMRAVFLPDRAESWEPGGSWQLGMIALVLAAWAVVGLVLGIRGFRWKRRGDE